MLEINEGSGLDMFQSFMSECNDELNENYESFLSHYENDESRKEKTPPTYMEFCLMEFINYSFTLFKDVMNDSIPKDVKMVMDMMEGKTKELPN
tara:strand:+ start:326 stop:607 length:282 start_codon:yes stop_codon:yes gene_type:complete